MENFSIRAKKTIKRIAAVGATGIMLGATIGGAMAASLGDYPAPFVSGGNFQSAALVIGDASAGSDTLALTDISTKLQSVASSQPGGTTAATTTTLTGGKIVEVPLGLGIANTSSAGFDIEVKQSDVSTLRKDVITFQSDTYNTHDALVLGRSSPSIATAISEGQKDFGTDVALKLAQTGVIKYLYAFDTSINISAASTSDPLEIVFLGKPLKITKVGSGTSFTATVGEEHFINYGESVTVAGHTVKLENIGSSSCVVSVDGGTSTTITTGSTKTIGGVQVKCDSVVSRNTLAESAATLIVGTTATKTYNDQDPYVGEDKINPKWVWSINGIDPRIKNSTSVSTVTSLPTVNGIEFGIKSYFTRQTPADNPAKVGECYNLPNNYLSICLDSLKVSPSSDYAEYKVEYISSTDLTRNGLASLTAAPTIHLIGPTEGFILQNPSGANWQQNGTSTSDKKTNEIWLTTFGSAATQFNATGVFYKDSDGVMQYAGNITNASRGDIEFARINYGSVKDTDIRVLLEGGLSTAGGEYNLTFSPQNGISSSTWNYPVQSGNVTIALGLSSGAFNRLGATATTEESSELRATTGPATVQSIGSWDKDVLNPYGIIIKNPKSNGVADRVIMWIPNEQQVAKVRVTGTASVSTGAAAVVSSTAPASRKASEIADIGQYNAVLVGGPCVNKHVATLLGLTYPSCGTDSKIPTGTATIQLVAQTSGKQALIVAGYEADDTRRAGVALKNYDDSAIKTAMAGKSSVTVTGQTLDLSGIKVA